MSDPAVYDRHDWLAGRILHLVQAGERWGDKWRYPPGAMPWHAVRTGVSGRVKGEEFRITVDDLLAEGVLLEVWLKMLGRRTDGHMLLIPGRSSVLRWPVRAYRGLPAVIAGEPWGPALAGQAKG